MIFVVVQCCKTALVIPSVVMFCLIFDGKFRLQMRLHGNCGIRPPAGRPCQKYLTKCHDWGDDADCTHYTYHFPLHSAPLSAPGSGCLPATPSWRSASRRAWGTSTRSSSSTPSRGSSSTPCHKSESGYWSSFTRWVRLRAWGHFE